MGDGTEGVAGPVTLTYGDDETGGPSIFWTNPWSDKQEKIASLWWPTHPAEDTEAIEATWAAFQRVWCEAWNTGDALRLLGASSTVVTRSVTSAPLPPVALMGHLQILTKHGEDRVWRPAMAAIAEISRLRAALKAVRVYVQDCIENGHDRTMLGNMYGARDEIDAAVAKGADIAERDGRGSPSSGA